MMRQAHVRFPWGVSAVLAGALVVATPVALEAAELLTLDRAVELAQENNLSLRAAREEYEAAKWSLVGARAALFPTVGFSSRVTRVDPETYRRANQSLEYIEGFGVELEPFLYETTYETSFSVTVPIWNGGKLWAGVGAADAARDAALHAHDSRRRAVEVEAKSAYFDVLRAESLLAVARQAVDASRRKADAARLKLSVGLVARAELLRWQVQLASDEKAMAEAERALTIARTRLAEVLGVPLDREFALAGVSRAELDARVQRLEWLLGDERIAEDAARDLLAGNPDFLALGDATRIARSNLSIARGAFLPSLNASGSYGWKADDDIEPDDETAWTATLVLDLPVFTSFQNLSQYRTTKRSYLAAVNRQEEGERALVAALRNAVAALKASLAGLEAADREVAHAEELLKNVTSLHAQGLAPYTDLVDAMVLHSRSVAGRVNALYDCFIALAEVERLIGREERGTTGVGR